MRSRRTLRHAARSHVFLLIRQQTLEPIAYRRVSCCLDRIDPRTQPMDAFNGCRRRAVTMRLDGTSLKDTSVQGEMPRTTVIATVMANEAGRWASARFPSRRRFDRSDDLPPGLTAGSTEVDQLLSGTGPSSQSRPLWSERLVSVYTATAGSMRACW